MRLGNGVIYAEAMAPVVLGCLANTASILPSEDRWPVEGFGASNWLVMFWIPVRARADKTVALMEFGRG